MKPLCTHFFARSEPRVPLGGRFCTTSEHLEAVRVPLREALSEPCTTSGRTSRVSKYPRVPPRRPLDYGCRIAPLIDPHGEPFPGTETTPPGGLVSGTQSEAARRAQRSLSDPHGAARVSTLLLVDMTKPRGLPHTSGLHNRPRRLPL